MNCPNCHNHLPDEARFCNLCGAVVTKYSAPEGFQIDPSSGFYYQSQTWNDPNSGKPVQWVTWFDPQSGEYQQVSYPAEEPGTQPEQKPAEKEETEPTPEPMAEPEVAVVPEPEDVLAFAPQPEPEPVLVQQPAIQIPKDFIYDPASGVYYKAELGVDPATAASGTWYTYFYPATGDLQKIFYAQPETSTVKPRKTADKTTVASQSKTAKPRRKNTVIIVVLILLAVSVGSLCLIWFQGDEILLKFLSPSLSHAADASSNPQSQVVSSSIETTPSAEQEQDNQDDDTPQEDPDDNTQQEDPDDNTQQEDQDDETSQEDQHEQNDESETDEDSGQSDLNNEYKDTHYFYILVTVTNPKTLLLQDYMSEEGMYKSDPATYADQDNRKGYVITKKEAELYVDMFGYYITRNENLEPEFQNELVLFSDLTFVWITNMYEYMMLLEGDFHIENETIYLSVENIESGREFGQWPMAFEIIGDGTIRLKSSAIGTMSAGDLFHKE